MLGVVVQIYIGVKSVFPGLAFGVLRRFLTGGFSMLAWEFQCGVVL